MDNLLQFQIVNRNGKIIVFNIEKDNNYRIIYFYRNEKEFSTQSNSISSSYRYPIQGYQKTINGTNIKFLIKLYNNDNFEITDK